VTLTLFGRSLLSIASSASIVNRLGSNSSLPTGNKLPYRPHTYTQTYIYTGTFVLTT
jgi:hypothetical protein